jgi:hypothetical protein
MPILNYTTSVEAAKSIDEIQRILARHGARSITTDYDDNGNVSGIMFTIQIEGLPLSVRLPVNVEGVFDQLWKAKGVPRKAKSRLQARRVAWRILKDWLEAQLALYEAGQAEMGQVLMPYAIDAQGVTAYQMFKESHVKQLTSAPDNVVEGKFKAANGTE